MTRVVRGQRQEAAEFPGADLDLLASGIAGMPGRCEYPIGVAGFLDGGGPYGEPLAYVTRAESSRRGGRLIAGAHPGFPRQKPGHADPSGRRRVSVAALGYGHGCRGNRAGGGGLER